MPNWSAIAAESLDRQGWLLDNGVMIETLTTDRHLHPVQMTDDDDPDGGGRNGQTGIATKTRTRTQKPKMYKVLLLNDDYTPMEFVVHVLQRFFRLSVEEATRVMLHVHQRGVGVCGIFTYEVAETKVTQVIDFARQHQHPLQCTMEED
jgi:ATP-dependent Clp protease adaptor protein ClpS